VELSKLDGKCNLKKLLLLKLSILALVFYLKKKKKEPLKCMKFTYNAAVGMEFLLGHLGDHVRLILALHSLQF
jgi:hypothetical protein